MGLEEHDNIIAVPDDTTIWRYYNTSKFLSLVENSSLYFSRIDQFEDPFEGYAPTKNLKKELVNRRDLRDNLEELYGDVESGEFPGVSDPGDGVSQVYEHLRNQSLANCWCIGESDKLSMWNSYISNGDGVAISTTFGNLKEAIRRGEDFEYYAGEVKYYNYFSDFLKTNNYFDFIMSKPTQYSFENEMRLVMWWPVHGDPNPQTGPNDVLVERDPAPTGQEFKVDVDHLIEDVYISPFSPPWNTVDVWEGLLREVGISANVKTSQLAMEPEDYL